MEKSKLPQELQKSLEELESLRDEIRVKLHLATAETKSTWKDLEPKLARIETRLQREGRGATDAAMVLMSDLKRAFRDFRDRLRA